MAKSIRNRFQFRNRSFFCVPQSMRVSDSFREFFVRFPQKTTFPNFKLHVRVQC